MPLLASMTTQSVDVRRNRGGQDLDGDVAAEPRIARTIDLAYPTGSEQLD